MSANIALTVQNCASAHWVRSQSRSGVFIYTFLNVDSTHSLTVTDNSGAGATTYTVPPNTYVRAWCSDSQGTTNRLYFPSTTRPTLTVTSGATLSTGNFDASGSSGTFDTSTGTNTLGGNAVVAGTGTFD